MKKTILTLSFFTSIQIIGSADSTAIASHNDAGVQSDHISVTVFSKQSRQDSFLSALARSQKQITTLSSQQFRVINQKKKLNEELKNLLVNDMKELKKLLEESKIKLQAVEATLENERSGASRKIKNGLWFLSGGIAGASLSAILTTYALLRLGTKNGWITPFPSSPSK